MRAPGQTVGVGAGQMSRVDSVKIGGDESGAAAGGHGGRVGRLLSVSRRRGGSGKHGATAVIQPGGSVRDAEVIAAADRLGVAMVFTGVRHFRH